MPIYKKFGLIKIDDARIDETCSAYFKWKDLNAYIKSNSNRGINMPDAISEPMGCYCLDLVWNRGKKVGDATNPRTNDYLIESKEKRKEILTHLRELSNSGNTEKAISYLAAELVLPVVLVFFIKLCS